MLHSLFIRNILTSKFCTYRIGRWHANNIMEESWSHSHEIEFFKKLTLCIALNYLAKSWLTLGEGLEQTSTRLVWLDSRSPVFASSLQTFLLNSYTLLQKYRYTRNFLETRVIIKILAHPFYPINVDNFHGNEAKFCSKWPTQKLSNFHQNIMG